MEHEKANFFWHGSPLSLQERVCISSFVKNGFDVRVFSYNDLELPEGANYYDASEILPVSEIGKYTQAGMPANLAAFSDAFRYQVIKKKGGWWFDTDVMCLATSDQFAQIIAHKGVKISAGYQSTDVIACGVLYIDDSSLINKIIVELDNVGTEFEWGAIGPTLVTRVINESNLAYMIEPEDYFYPIQFTEFRRMYDPGWTDWCKSRINGSMSVHLWNEIRHRDQIPKNILPPEGSFLHGLYLNTCPEFDGLPALPLETAHALFEYSDLKDKHQRLIYECERLNNFEKKIKSNFVMSLLLALYVKLKQTKLI